MKESDDQNEGCLKLTFNLCVFSEEGGRVADLRFHNYHTGLRIESSYQNDNVCCVISPDTLVSSSLFLVNLIWSIQRNIWRQTLLKMYAFQVSFTFRTDVDHFILEDSL